MNRNDKNLTMQERAERTAAEQRRAKVIALDIVMVLIVLAIIAAITGYLSEGLKAAAAEQQYEDVRQEIVASGTHEINFAVVQANGAMATSWIYLPDTGIDYPMVQGKDNDTYLAMDAYGNPSTAGAIFINYANSPDISDAKTLIFGHNMNDGSMFTPLHKFKDEEFGKVHTDAYIYLDTGECKHYRLRYYIFTDPLNENVYITDEEESAEDANLRLKAEADIVYGDYEGGNLICLSTCTYHTKRTVVVYEFVDNKRPIAGMSEKMEQSLSENEAGSVSFNNADTEGETL